MVSMNTVKRRVIPIVLIKEKFPAFPMKERITEKINQPIKSLTMAPATMTIPILVLNKFMSIKIRTTTGRAVIDMAVPMNKEKSNFLSSEIPKKSGK